jgi:hypothetical protein
VPTWAIVTCVIAAVLMMDSMVFYALLRAGWSELTQDLPSVAPEPGAVRREFQTFKAGMYNLGWSVHVAVDESHLHLYPAAIIRWAGGKPASIPWERIQIVTPAAKATKVKIGKATVIGPTWCLEMAASGA